MTIIKELNDWIKKRREWLLLEQKKQPNNKSIELALINLDIFDRRFKELAKKDLRKIEPLLKKGGNWNIVIARAYKEDLEEVVGNVIPKRNAIEVSFKLLKDGRWEEEKR